MTTDDHWVSLPWLGLPQTRNPGPVSPTTVQQRNTWPLAGLLGVWGAGLSMWGIALYGGLGLLAGLVEI